jgi:hypothetical protein
VQIGGYFKEIKCIFPKFVRSNKSHGYVEKESHGPPKEEDEAIGDCSMVG